MDTIDIVTTGHLATELGQIIACLRHLGIHVAFITYLLNQRGVLLAQQFTTLIVPFAHRNRHNPGMELHAAFMTLVDTELQRVVAGMLTRGSRQTDIPWL